MADQGTRMQSRPEPNSTSAKRAWTWRQALWQAAPPIVGSLLITVAILAFRGLPEQLGEAGYLGAFGISLVSSATILIPAPGLAYIFGIADKMNPWLLGAVAGVGSGLGETTGYWMGRGGNVFFQRSRFYEKTTKLTARWGGPAIFVLAVLPAPFDVAGAWAGATRYPLWKFLSFVIPGKIVKFTGVALAGAFSVPWLLRFFGISL